MYWRGYYLLLERENQFIAIYTAGFRLICPRLTPVLNKNETSRVVGLISEEELEPVSEEELALEILEHDYIVRCAEKKI